MTKFEKNQFDYHGGYLNYHLDGYPSAWARRKFVARFKYVKGEKASFLAFLIKNFTVEEYFGLYDTGLAPQQILETKGYVQAHVKKLLRAGGYPETIEGRDQYIKDQVARRLAA